MKNRTYIIVFITLTLACFIAVFVPFLVKEAKRNKEIDQKFDRAVALIEEEKYDEALNVLEWLYGVKGEEQYELVLQLMEKDEYTVARQLFEHVDKFFYIEDSIKKLDELKDLENAHEQYKEALEYMSHNNYVEAKEIFDELGDYKDSKNYAIYADAASKEMYEAESLYRSLPTDFLDVKQVLSFLDANREWSEKMYYCHKYDNGSAIDDNVARIMFFRYDDGVGLAVAAGRDIAFRLGGINGYTIKLDRKVPDDGFEFKLGWTSNAKVTSESIILSNYYHDGERIFTAE